MITLTTKKKCGVSCGGYYFLFKLNYNMNKVVSITKAKPVEANLPVGNYIGKLGGYVIEVKYNGTKYHVNIEEGIRGVNIPVIVIVGEDYVTYEDIKNGGLLTSCF